MPGTTQQPSEPALMKSASFANGAATTNEKPKKRICCACPDTKKARDECIVLNGEDACKQLIEAHKSCLRKEGFNV